MSQQTRIQRTYRVALVPFTTGEPIEVKVNLSYPLDEAPEPNSVIAQFEAVERLRRLARNGRPTADGQLVTSEDIESRDWKVSVARQVLVKVDLDDDGNPIRKAEQ